MIVKTMEILYYRTEVTGPGFDIGATADAIREELVKRATPEGHRERSTDYRFIATDRARQHEPYTFDMPLPEWAIGVLFIVEVTFEPVAQPGSLPDTEPVGSPAGVA